MVLTLHSIRRLRIQKFIGNLSSTSGKIKTKSEPLISTALARMLIKTSERSARSIICISNSRHASVAYLSPFLCDFIFSLLNVAGYCGLRKRTNKLVT